MITLPICLFLAVFAIADSETIDGVALFVDPPPADPPLRDGDPCKIESFNKIVCEHDTLIFCDPSNKIALWPCKFNERPGFCNCERTACVAKKPNCGLGEGNTDCLTPNTKLPNNLNCHQFSYCNENSKKVTMQCPGSLVYDPNTETCMARSEAVCTKLVCPKNNIPKLIPFPQARNYYVLCYQGVGDVRKCSDKYYAVKGNSCQFDCKMIKKSGSFKDTKLENCENGIYYVCNKIGQFFITRKEVCPKGMYFDENLVTCTTTNTCKENTNPPSKI